jgi:SulP family sulfate permease
MDRLRRSHFLDELSGRVFLSQYDAWKALTGGHGDLPGTG